MTSTATTSVPPLLVVDDLHARLAAKARAEPPVEVLRGLDLMIADGEMHVITGPDITGPDGRHSGTLGRILLGSPSYEVTAGSVCLRGDEVTDWPTDERAKIGMFLAVDSPHEIPGVSVIQLLRQAMSARGRVDLSVTELRRVAIDWSERLGMEVTLVDRHLDGEFSDHERQCVEIVLMAILEPELAILDRIDAGLDIDELRDIARGIDAVRAARPQMGVVLVADDRRLIDAVEPDRVHVLTDGCIVRSGGPELAEHIERQRNQAVGASA